MPFVVYFQYSPNLHRRVVDRLSFAERYSLLFRRPYRRLSRVYVFGKEGLAGAIGVDQPEIAVNVYVRETAFDIRKDVLRGLRRCRRWRYGRWSCRRHGRFRVRWSGRRRSCIRSRNRGGRGGGRWYLRRGWNSGRTRAGRKRNFDRCRSGFHWDLR